MDPGDLVDPPGAKQSFPQDTQDTCKTEHRTPGVATSDNLFCFKYDVSQHTMPLSPFPMFGASQGMVTHFIIQFLGLSREGPLSVFEFLLSTIKARI